MSRATARVRDRMTPTVRTAQALPLREIRINATAGGGLARTVVRQRYENTSEEPIEVVYKTPLPSDGAVAGYAFDIGERRIEGVIKRRQDARQAYDQALYEGRTAALLDEERDGLFTLHLGAVPPGAEVIAELTVDHPLGWRPGEGWEWRFPTTLVPRYLGGPGRVSDADRLTFPVSQTGTGVTVSAVIDIDDERADGPRRVELPAGPPDRDLVVRWAPVTLATDAAAAVRIESIHRAGDDMAYAMLTLTPPAPERAEGAAVPRDVIVLLDTSGSMMGEPLNQAKGVVGALIDGLGDADRLEMLAFAMEVERWDPEGKQDAHAWLRGRRAGGGTEMRSAVIEALKPLRANAQRQVVLVTDGQVGFEEEVVRHVHQGLPARSRLHCVGVGACINRTLTRHASRAGRGREVLLEVGEDCERAANVLDAVTRAPVLTNLSVKAGRGALAAPAKMADVLLGEPARVYLRLPVEGGPVRVSGRTADGPWKAIIEAPPASSVPVNDPRAAVAGAYGRERVADLELSRIAGRRSRGIDRQVEALGLKLGLATRLTSWVAVDDQVSVDPGGELLMVDMPHDMGHGLSAEGLGLRSAMRGFGSGRYHKTMLSQREAGALADAAAPSLVSESFAQHVEVPYGIGPDEDGDPQARCEEMSADARDTPDVEFVVQDGKLVLVLNCDFELSVGEILVLVLDLGRRRTLRVKVVQDLGGAWVLDGPIGLAGRVEAVLVRDVRLSARPWS